MTEAPTHVSAATTGPYAMTVQNLRRRSEAVYLACEESVAKDISEALKWAADEIERLSVPAQGTLNRSSVLEEAARVAQSGCLVPPDGGSPTEDERQLCEEIASRIRLLKYSPDPTQDFGGFLGAPLNVHIHSADPLSEIEPDEEACRRHDQKGSGSQQGGRGNEVLASGIERCERHVLAGDSLKSEGKIATDGGAQMPRRCPAGDQCSSAGTGAATLQEVIRVICEYDGGKCDCPPDGQCCSEDTKIARALLSKFDIRSGPQTRQEPVAWRSKQAGSEFWQVHVNDPTEAIEKYATVAYEIAPLFACSTCDGTGKVKSKNPERDKAWEVPCPACSVTRPHHGGRDGS